MWLFISSSGHDIGTVGWVHQPFIIFFFFLPPFTVLVMFVYLFICSSCQYVHFLCTSGFILMSVFVPSFPSVMNHSWYLNKSLSDTVSRLFYSNELNKRRHQDIMMSHIRTRHVELNGMESNIKWFLFWLCQGGYIVHWCVLCKNYWKDFLKT